MAATDTGPVAFLPLNYVVVKLPASPEAAIKNRVVTVEDTIRRNAKAIVYLNQRLPSNKIIKLDVKEAGSSSTHSFELGVTTCDIDTISNYFYHVQDECNEQFICGGLSKSMILGSASELPIESVEFTKDSSDLIKVIINGRTESILKDETGRMNDKPLSPYIILSGSARCIEISEGPMAQPSEVVDEDLATSAFQSLWKLADGVNWNNRDMYRKPDSHALYAYCSLSLRKIEQLSFVIKEADDTWNGSLSLVITDWSMGQVYPNRMPRQPSLLNSSQGYARHCKSYINPVSIVAPGTRVALRLEAAGLYLEVNQLKHLMCTTTQLSGFREFYVFLHFGGKVSRIEFDIPPEALKDVSKSQESVPLKCLICDEKPATHEALPCGHVTMCPDCANHHGYLCLFCNEPIIGEFVAFN